MTTTHPEAVQEAVRRAVDVDRLVKPEELAQRWSCTRQHIYTLLRQGMPSLKLGTARRIRIRDAEEWLEAQQA